MARPLLDIYEEHRDEAAFLRLRRARLDAMLEGDARHEQMLEARLAAHLDALHADIKAAAPLIAPWIASRDVHERYVALAALLPTAHAREVLEPLRAAGVPVAAEPAVYAALAAYGARHGIALVEHWLGEGDLRHQALGLRLLGRWGDARAEKIARRALRRPGAVVQRAAFAVLTALGARDVLGLVDALFAECATPAEREDVLRAIVPVDPELARGYARRALAAGASCGAAGPVLCGAAGTADDRAVLGKLCAATPSEAGVLVGAVLAGDHAALDALWDAADEPALSNALREASYALLGDTDAPRVLGARACEDKDERAARLTENAALRARMRALPPGTRGLWGAHDVTMLRATRERLGPRHRAWATWASAGA